ncbi:MAG: FlgD immunoglobulin-like domain containing protein [Gaiellaceae bacterium]
MRRRAGMTLLAVGLLLGTVAAFTYTEALKLERSPVGGARFDRWLSPVCDCPHETAALSFQLRQAERISVAVVDSDDERVRQLATAIARPPGRVTFTWDGRDQAGEVVPDGAYRLRIRLLDERRRIVVPEDVLVDTKAPRVRLRGVSPTVLSTGETLVVRYRSDEGGVPILVVDGLEVLRGDRRAAGSRRLRWPDAVAEGMLSPGFNDVRLVVEDAAGNRSEPTAAITILVA